MNKNFFIAGTDTDAGKTLITRTLLHIANARGLRTTTMKPIAAGSDCLDGEIVNRDAWYLHREASENLSYAQVNPLLLDHAIAPHIAADLESRRLTARSVTGFINGFLLSPADIRFIEGAGGWLVPLNTRETLADALRPVSGLSVILVVGLRLGCLNHALLTAAAIRQSGLHLAGWAGSQIDGQMKFPEENVSTLKHMLPAPCLGIVPFIPEITPEKAAVHLNLPEGFL